MLIHVVVNRLIRSDTSYSNDCPLQRTERSCCANEEVRRLRFETNLCDSKKTCEDCRFFFFYIACEVIYYQDNASRSALCAVVILLIMMMMMMMTARRRRRTASTTATIVAFYYSHRQAVTLAQTVGRGTNERKSGRRRVGARERKNCLSLQKKSCQQPGGWEKKGEARDDKFKTLSFASIYSPGRKRKSQVRVVERHGSRSFALSLSLPLSLSLAFCFSVYQGCYRRHCSY